MPLRFAVSEKPATSLPLAGQTQSTRSSSWSSGGGWRATSGLLSLRAVGGAVATSDSDAGAGPALAASCRSRTARSEYGSFNAFGLVFRLPAGAACATTGGGVDVAGGEDGDVAGADGDDAGGD